MVAFLQSVGENFIDLLSLQNLNISWKEKSLQLYLISIITCFSISMRTHQQWEVTILCILAVKSACYSPEEIQNSFPLSLVSYLFRVFLISFYIFWFSSFIFLFSLMFPVLVSDLCFFCVCVFLFYSLVLFILISLGFQQWFHIN